LKETNLIPCKNWIVIYQQMFNAAKTSFHPIDAKKQRDRKYKLN